MVVSPREQVVYHGTRVGQALKGRIEKTRVTHVLQARTNATISLPPECDVSGCDKVSRGNGDVIRTVCRKYQENPKCQHIRPEHREISIPVKQDSVRTHFMGLQVGKHTFGAGVITAIVDEIFRGNLRVGIFQIPLGIHGNVEGKRFCVLHR